MAFRGGLFSLGGHCLVKSRFKTSRFDCRTRGEILVAFGSGTSKFGPASIHKVNITKRSDDHHRRFLNPLIVNASINKKLQQTLSIGKKQLSQDHVIHYANAHKEQSRSYFTHNLLPINCDNRIYSNIVPLQKKFHNSDMLNATFSRLLSTVQKNTFGSGVPIENDDDTLLSSAEGIKKIRINACGELYAELCKTRPTLFSGAPKGKGIDFIVQYYDSLELLAPEIRSTAPIVCLLHGAPGHFKDFAALIKYLTSKGVRVIAPNFPEYSATYEHSFRHSPKERLEYLLEFLEAINLRHIDMLAGHSSAVYTMFELLDQTLNGKIKRKLQVKSLGLLSTPSYNLPRNMEVTPFRLFTLKLFDYPILRPVILALIHIFVKIQGIQNRVEKNKIENLLIAASAVGYSESEKMSDQIKLVHKFKIPTYLAFGCNDRLLPMRCFEQLKKDLGIKSSRQVKFYNHQGELTQDVNEPNELVEVSQFVSGGHYTFQKYSQQVNEDIYNFLKRKVLSGSKEEESTKL